MIRRIRTLVILPVMVLPVIALMLLTSIAYASNAAVVINGGQCGLIDGNGNGIAADGLHSVTTHSGNGLVTCKATVTPSDTGKAVKWDSASFGGATCTVGDEETEDWQETVSASGQAMLVCHLKN